jgi:hypothetical protein
MPTFAIHGDTRPLAGAETIETRDALARFMFVTIEPGAPGEVWIRAVAPHELASFHGPLYQIDKDDATIILREVRVQFWPFGPGGDSLDEILHAAFDAFYASLAAPNGGWFAKERDCVNRFVMSQLVPACTPGSVLHDPAQIGIESAVKQPAGIGQRRTSPADIAIWATPHGNCWSPEMLPVAAPLAVLEWKCNRPGKEKQKPDDDRAWLTAFTTENLASLGYSVLVDFTEGSVLRRLTVSRCEGREWSEGWFERPARET